MRGNVGDWPQTIKDVRTREGVIVLDLTTFPSDQAIEDKYSWDKKDFTHCNEAGARKMAELSKILHVTLTMVEISIFAINLSDQYP